MSINKAVITAGGLGTRFLPLTKAYQKEMIALLDKPQMHYIVEEAILCGITEIAIVVPTGRDSISKYFDLNDTYIDRLEDMGKGEKLEDWRNFRNSFNLTIIEQSIDLPYGNGSTFIASKEFTKDEPFVAMWGDDLMFYEDSTVPRTVEQLIEYYTKYNPVAVMSTQKVSPSQISKFGSYKYKDDSSIPYQAETVIEKPKPDEAPSLNANACRFVLTPFVIEELEKMIRGKDNELWLTDAINRLMHENRLVIAPPIEGSKWIAVGDKAGWLEANLYLANKDPELSERLSI